MTVLTQVSGGLLLSRASAKLWRAGLGDCPVSELCVNSLEASGCRSGTTPHPARPPVAREGAQAGGGAAAVTAAVTDAALGAGLLVAHGGPASPGQHGQRMGGRSECNDHADQASGGLPPAPGGQLLWSGWARRLPGVGFVRSAMRRRKADGEHKSAPGTSAGDAVGRSRGGRRRRPRSSATVIGHGHRPRPQPRIRTLSSPPAFWSPAAPSDTRSGRSAKAAG